MRDPTLSERFGLFLDCVHRGRRIAQFKKLLLAAVCFSGVAAAPALAGSVTYTGYSVLNNQTVTLNDTSVGVNNEQGGSGEIALSGTNTAGGMLAAWCVDILHMLQGSGTFASGALETGTFANAFNALVTNVTPMLGSNNDASSALQVAIWQEEYGSGLTISAPASVASLANAYETNVVNGTWVADATKTVSLLGGGGNNQTLAYLSLSLNGATTVPEPASMMILAAGLFGVGVLRRKRG